MVFGAREVGEVGDTHGHVHLRFRERGDGALRGRVVGAGREGVLDRGADGAAGRATEGCEVVQGALVCRCYLAEIEEVLGDGGARTHLCKGRGGEVCNVMEESGIEEDVEEDDIVADPCHGRGGWMRWRRCDPEGDVVQ